MVDQEATKDEASDGTRGETTNERKVAQGNKPFKKKGFRSNNDYKKYKGIPDLLKGVGFTISRDGPDLYLKVAKRLGSMCAPHTEMCLEAEELILPEEPVLPKNPMAHQQKMWDLWATEAIKNEETLRQNMRSLYPVVISLCDSNIEDKVKAHGGYEEIKCINVAGKRPIPQKFK